MGVLSDLPMHILLAATGVLLLAGFVKGAVGFAMPMIAITGLSSLLPGEMALAGLILPTLMTNLVQAFRQGRRAAWSTARRYGLFLVVMVLCLLGSAQLVRVLPQNAFYLVLGLFVTGFAALSLSGWRPVIPSTARRRAEVGLAAIAGLVGGLSGVWGPPTVLYLHAIEADKHEAMRVQGVIYGVGAVMLMAAHLRSGIFNAQTAPLSALLVVPAGLGLILGARLHDRMPQQTFRRVTMAVLFLAGLNLVRRGLVG